MRTQNLNITYDDVYSAVQSLLDQDVLLDDITLRLIRKENGECGSLETISKHFRPIKERLKHGEPIGAPELSETDMDALRSLVGGIVERRTVLARKEQEDSAKAMSDVVRGHESDLAQKQEIIEDLADRMVVLDEDNSAKDALIDKLKAEVVRLKGNNEALGDTIRAFASSVAAQTATDGEAKDRLAADIENNRPKGEQIEMSVVNDTTGTSSDAVRDDQD